MPGGLQRNEEEGAAGREEKGEGEGAGKRKGVLGKVRHEAAPSPAKMRCRVRV